MSAVLAQEEALWAGPIGRAYTAAHARPRPARQAFWQRLLAETEPESVLEVGCGAGANLAQMPATRRVGFDLNATALACLPAIAPGAQGVRGSIAALPFRDRCFALVVSAGVLIHVPQRGLVTVFGELARVSARHLLLVEYEDTYWREIPWRGQRDVLWAGPYGLTFWRQHPEWQPVLRGDVGAAEGFDRCGYSLFRRQEAG